MAPVLDVVGVEDGGGGHDVHGLSVSLGLRRPWKYGAHDIGEVNSVHALSGRPAALEGQSPPNPDRVLAGELLLAPVRSAQQADTPVGHVTASARKRT